MNVHDFISNTSPTHRRKYGQFFTPKPVADVMVSWILRGHPKTILDPAFGLGVFFESLRTLGGSPGVSMKAFEIDAEILHYLQECECHGLDLTLGDYLLSDTGSFDAIVCNPPYLRFQNFMNRHEVVPKIEELIGTKLLGYTNVASIFLIKALHELKKGGRLAFIMPYEFFNTGYGKEVKKRLVEDGLLKQIVLFENEAEIFPEATTTVCVLLGYKNGKREPVKVTRIQSLDELSQIRDIETHHQHEIDIDTLQSDKKWTPVLSGLFGAQDIPEGFCEVRTYGKFVRGIATGANDFFALNRSKIEDWALSDRHYRKCITKGPLVQSGVFTCDDFERLAQGNKLVYCLDVAGDVNESAKCYIAHGTSLGYHKRYLTRNRSPWYQIEVRAPSPLWFGVFHRGRLKVVRNLTDAITFTCFHNFYPNDLGKKYVNHLFVYFLSDLGQRVLKVNKRDYGAKLDKFEPGDLNGCLCPDVTQFERIIDTQVLSVVELAKADLDDAIALANELMAQVVDD